MTIKQSAEDVVMTMRSDDPNSLRHIGTSRMCCVGSMGVSWTLA